MKLHHFREVISIAEQGSIRAAARSLQVSQPALTRSLAELERELGAPLFERRLRGVIATPLGQAFLARARSIMQEVRRAREEIEQLSGASAGTVNVGLSIAAHLALLPGVLGPFRKRYPDAKLHIIEGLYPTLEQGLRGGEIDFYVGVDPGGTAGAELSREIVFPNTRTVLCRTSHPLAGSTSLAQLCTAQWATTSITASAEDEFGAIFHLHGLSMPALCLQTQSALSLMICLLHTDLLAMVPVQWNEFDPTRGLLTAISVREELAAPPMVVIKRIDLPLTPAATYLLDLLKRGRIMPLDHPSPTNTLRKLG